LHCIYISTLVVLVRHIHPCGSSCCCCCYNL